jgi:hypothetical protein
MHSRPSASLLLAAIVAVAAILSAACSPTAGGPRASEAIASPPASLPASPTAGPPATPSAEPTANPEPTTAPTPQPTFTPREQALLDMIRPDAREACTPHRANLPEAAAGVECRPAKGPAARVGFYAYANDHDAATAYFARLAEHRVKPLSGDCVKGVPGDNAWLPGDLEPELRDDPDAVVIDDNAYMAQRDGCFLDGGTANVRLTCDGGIYVGVLGRSDDLAALFDWTWSYAPGVEPSIPGAPGLCHYLQG